MAPKTDAASRRVRAPLSALVAAAWFAWIVTWIVAWTLYRMQVLHPHFLPLAILLSMQVLAGALAFFKAAWVILLGPRRLAALGWLFVLLVPACMWCGLATQCLWYASARDATPKYHWINELGVGLASWLADAEARWRYSQRETGARTVMLHNGVREPAKAVAAMDAHIEAIEELLGKQGTKKVFWVRGSLVGQSGMYIHGYALGSSHDHGTDDSALAGVDRHEVAHFAIDQFRGPDAEPPALLSEGWAESQSGNREGWLAARAWQSMETADSIRVLLRHAYFDKTGAAYDQGGALVDYILRAHGSQKFFKLYTTCRQETFEQDCRRVLGVDLDELDRAYWRDVEEQVADRTAAQLDEEHRKRLQSVSLAAHIDRELWNEIAKHYSKAFPVLRAASAHVSTSGTRQLRVRDRRTQTLSEKREQFYFASRNQQRGLRISAKSQGDVIVASRLNSFWLTAHNGQWASNSGQHTYHANWLTMKTMIPLLNAAYSIDRKNLLDFMLDPNLSVVGLNAYVENGEERMRVEFTKQGDPVAQTGAFVLSPTANWRLESYEIKNHQPGDEPSIVRATVEYSDDRSSALPTRMTRTSLVGGKVRHEVEIEATHQTTFKLDELFLLQDAVVGEVASASAKTPWYVELPWRVGGVSLFLGALLIATSYYLSYRAKDGR